MLLGVCVTIQLVIHVPYTGLPAGQTVRVEGVCISDSYSVADDRVLVAVRLEKVGNRTGTITSASGKVVLFLESTEKIYWGERITAIVNPSRLDEEKKELSFSGIRDEKFQPLFQSRLFQWRADIY